MIVISDDSKRGEGEREEILNFYRKRSGVLGKEVMICFDDACGRFVSGKAVGIGDDLALY